MESIDTASKKPRFRIINKTQEAIKKMSFELRQFLNELWEMSVQETVRLGKLPKVDVNYRNPDIPSLAVQHKKICDAANTDQLSCIDRSIFNLYRATLRTIIEDRTITALMTNFLEKFVDQLMWITIWYNHICDSDKRIAADIVSNRKGLTPQLAKAILKNVNIVVDENCQPHARIRDLYRGSYTINQDDEKLLKQLINIIAINILTNPESSEHIAFYEWVKSSPKVFGGMKVPKEDLLEFQQFNFELNFVKDYIKEPKGAYQAWQGTYTISSAPEHLSLLHAKMFEFKFWTFKMKNIAEHGEASHDEYKRELYEFIQEVFPVNVQLGDLDFYVPGQDENGVTQSRNVYCRNVSPSTIPETS